MSKMTRSSMMNLARLAERYRKMAETCPEAAQVASDAADAAFDAEVEYSMRIIAGERIKEQTGTVRFGWSSLMADLVHGIGAADQIASEEPAASDPDETRIGQVWEDEPMEDASDCAACARVARYGSRCRTHAR